MVPEEQAPREMVQPVVVGIDASSASVEALRLAVEEARAHRTRVRAVHVWHVSEQEYLAGFAPGANAVEEYRVRANRLLTDSLAQVASRGSQWSPSCSRRSPWRTHSSTRVRTPCSSSWGRAGCTGSARPSSAP